MLLKILFSSAILWFSCSVSAQLADSTNCIGYVIKRDGADYFNVRDSIAEASGHLDYATAVNVLKAENGWMSVTLEQYNDTFFIQSKFIASGEDIQLNEDDLYQNANLSIGQDGKVGENSSVIKKFLEMHFVSAAGFLNQQKKGAHYFIQDTTSVKRKNGIFCLKTAKGDTCIKDTQFTYEGQYPALNAYVVSNVYPDQEVYGFDFIDKTTGATHFSFDCFPLLSYKKDLIVEINQNGDDLTADMTLFSVSRHSIQKLMSVNFTKWLAQEKHFCTYSCSGEEITAST